MWGPAADPFSCSPSRDGGGGRGDHASPSRPPVSIGALDSRAAPSSGSGRRALSPHGPSGAMSARGPKAPASTVRGPLLPPVEIIGALELVDWSMISFTVFDEC